MADSHKTKCLKKSEVLMPETREGQQKYEFLLELCQNGILIVQDGKIEESNHLMAKMCGYAVEELLDTEFASFFHPDDMKWVEKIYTRVIGDAHSIEIHETALMCKNGIKIFAEVTAVQFVDKQEPAVLFMIREITDHIRTENEPKKSSEMNPIAVLSGGVAHNYNNLLTAIIGTISQARAYTEKEVREIPDRVLPDAQ